MAAGRSGLGRGLGSLIPASEGSESREAGIAELPVKAIRPNPRQPRHHLDPEELDELVASIREHGVIQPIVVTRDGEGYALIAGERRWTAAGLAGLERIPAVIKEVTPQEMLELALVENVQRSDLNPLEEASAYQQLVNEFGFTQEQVAKRVGKNRSTVANSIRLLGLPERVLDALAKAEISEGHARALLGAQDPAELLGLFDHVASRHLSVRQTEDLVRRQRLALVAGRHRERALEDPEARQVEAMFREALGTRVEVVRSGSGGRLVIHYYNDEQLQAIYETLTRD
ncbi:MAG TPA: ParB/RepB/Spo0J family partition protein [Chloroflexota bacterium]|nr:ParB/RepB/Spo0J family partition protein [Chloroflexota bacterium]